MRALVLAVAISLSGCAISSRFIAGYGAIADGAGCGAGLTIAAVVIDGAVATLLLAGDEVSTLDKVVVGALAADTVIGGIEAIKDCTSD